MDTTDQKYPGRPLVLITNDDSVHAPGIHRLVEAVERVAHADIIVVAPGAPRSGASSALTTDSPLRITAHSDYHGARVFSVNGNPVDCVKLAMHAIVPRRPDFIFSGINHGSNSGNCVIYSGTMGAVLEGCMEGIPSVGFSLLHHSIKADFSLSESLVDDIIRRVMAGGLPNGVCLNVNIPSKIVPSGVRVCRAARGCWTDNYERYLSPSGVPFYMLTGRFVNEDADATDTDEYWLGKGYVSVVPVTPDMTDRGSIAPMAGIYNAG